ncbi:MAG: bifunctional alpha/beta hydrolase/OsmC family protein [Pseudomonadota bacterium]
MKYEFKNENGETLSGRLEQPAGEPRAYALFAHCFTCTKDLVAASSISKKLTEYGVAVLRFDFTGLGNSDGDFANTNFSSNVQDLVAAFHCLKNDFHAPEILVGHSLGGAAVLKAASLLPEIKAVVTLGAPSEVDHVSHLFQDNLEEIEEKGEAKVDLAGRPFTIKKQFVDDLKSNTVLDCVKNFKKSLLVMHSPIDNTVSIDHAGAIFSAAKHPKSFVSLDSADHLLLNRKDAEYAAGTIGAWLDRYLKERPNDHKALKVQKGEVVVKSRQGLKFTHDVYSKNHQLVADEPKSVKGDDLGMNPYELLLSSLGSCTAMTMKMYAERKGIQLSNVEVRLNHQKIHAEDCETCETEKGMVDQIDKHIHIEGEFTEEQKQRILEIAERCPVNRTLQSEIVIKSHH